MKKCNTCEQTKENNLFNTCLENSDGLRHICKECLSIYNKNYRKKNKEKLSAQKKDYYNSNKEALLSNMKIYYVENQKEITQYKREYFQQNKKHIYKKTRARINKSPELRISENLRGALKRVFKRNNINKTPKLYLDLLGCSLVDFKQHLESKFKDGMNWDNKGLYGWHIDHIIPLCSFDLTDKKQIKQAFHYTNLQPLWAKENLSKGKKILNQKEEE